MTYKQMLFERAIKLEGDMRDATAPKKDIIIKKFMDIMEELWASGWREEYDMWTQNIRE